jgi:peptide/nickel transport system ATP-binding protein
MSESSVAQRKRRTVLEVKHLAISYTTRKGDVMAVRDVSFDIAEGEAFGLVGESGCGKTTVAFGILNYLSNGQIVNGRVVFRDQELQNRSEKELRRLRGDQIAIVYQNASQALNPSMRIGDQLSDVLITHREMDRDAAHDRCVRMLRRVYMPDAETMMDRYPHQLSGGQQQRAVIAMTLLTEPALLIMDEPTTALDVTVEATVLDLIAELRASIDTAILYISHDLGVVARVADHVGVMYAGEIVELATVEEIFLQPVHPYTRGLLRCVPKLGSSKESSRLSPIPGRVPSPDEPMVGCLFAPRCEAGAEACSRERPSLQEVAPGHLVRCFQQHLDTGWEPPEGLASVEMEGSGDTDGERTVLTTEHLRTYYRQESKSILSLIGLGDQRYVKAVDDVSFRVPESCTFGIVGESGCGKSTLAKTIVGLEPLRDGRIEFLNIDISTPVKERGLELIEEIQMVFQNPDSTMNPSFTVGHQIRRPLQRFGTVPHDKVWEEVFRLLHAVKLDESYYYRLPRQLSGGEKQRVGIARALASRPELVLCDEPVSSLDVSVQAAILNLLLEIQKKYGTTMLLIAHDLSVVRFFCDHVMVMYLGKICELGPADAVYSPPYHPYTEALLSAAPIPDPTARQKRVRLEGSVPSALSPPEGCRFHTRCPHKVGEICERTAPPERTARDGHVIHCHIPLRELRQMDPVLSTQ